MDEQDRGSKFFHQPYFSKCSRLTIAGMILKKVEIIRMRDLPYKIYSKKVVPGCSIKKEIEFRIIILGTVYMLTRIF